jgi:hypothetical protein
LEVLLWAYFIGLALNFVIGTITQAVLFWPSQERSTKVQHVQDEQRESSHLLEARKRFYILRVKVRFWYIIILNLIFFFFCHYFVFHLQLLNFFLIISENRQTLYRENRVNFCVWLFVLFIVTIIYCKTQRLYMLVALA